GRAVQEQQALLVDEDFRAVGSFEDFVAEPRLFLPRKGVAQARAAAAFDADAQSALADALLGHQRPDLARRALADLNHDRPIAGLQNCRIAEREGERIFLQSCNPSILQSPIFTL